jgi:hypothetical protein
MYDTLEFQMTDVSISKLLKVNRNTHRLGVAGDLHGIARLHTRRRPMKHAGPLFCYSHHLFSTLKTSGVANRNKHRKLGVCVRDFELCFSLFLQINNNSKTMPSSKKQQQQQELLQQQRQLQQKERSRARAYANSDISHQKQKQRQRQRAQPPLQQLQRTQKADMPPRRSWAFTFGVLLVVLFVAAAGGILVWAFLPTNTKHNLQGIVNVTTDSVGDSSSSSGNGKHNDNNNNDASSNNNNNNTTDIETKWTFMQCQDAHTDCCNGLDDGFCDFKVNEVLYGLVHNAMASFEDDFFLLYNQNYNLEAALAAGYRALELDVARCGDGQKIAFYHGECALGTRDPLVVLKNVHSFLQENPSEIVMLFLQMDGQSVSLDDFYQIMAATVDSGGNSLADLLYSHPLDATEWPTLRALVQSNQRLIVFYWNQDDCAPGAGGPGCPPGFHYYYRYGVQTEWDFSRIADVQTMGGDISVNGEQENGNGEEDNDESTSSCSLSYTPNYKLGQQFFRVNAFLRLPSSSAAEDVLNQPAFIQERLDACSMQNPYNGSSFTERYYLRPNFYAVDFWEKGAVLESIQDYNIKLLQDKQFEAANLLNANDYELAQNGGQDGDDGGGATDLDALLSDANGGGGRLRERHRLRARQ